MTTDAVGGVWWFATRLAGELALRGWEVDLAVIGQPPSSDQYDAIAHSPHMHLHLLGHALEWQDQAGLEVPGLRAVLLDLERRTEPDLVHINGYREAAFGFRAPVLLTAHSCVPSWYAACRNEPLPSEWRSYASAVMAGLATAQAIVAPTEAFMHSLRACYGADITGSVVPNGAQPPTQLSMDREPLILAAGRCWDEAKNIGLLAKIAAELPWPITLAGDGSNRYANVHASGRLSQAELYALMDKAAIFCAPARYEPFGLGILEAAQRGAALVLGDIPSLRELWDGRALFVPPDDAHALQTALMRLIECPDLRRQLVRRSVPCARTYTTRRTAELYERHYLRLIYETNRLADRQRPLAEAAQ